MCALLSGYHYRAVCNSYSMEASAVRARMARGGVVKITIQHEAQPSAVLFIETTPPSIIRTRTARASRTMSYLLYVCVGDSNARAAKKPVITGLQRETTAYRWPMPGLIRAVCSLLLQVGKKMRLQRHHQNDHGCPSP